METKARKSSRLYFSKWLTANKASELKELFAEFNRARDFLKAHVNENNIWLRISMKEHALNNPEFINLYEEFKTFEGTFLTPALFYVAYREYIQALISWRTKAKTNQTLGPLPNIDRRRIVFSVDRFRDVNDTMYCISHQDAVKTIMFDYNLTLKEVRNDKGRYTLSIPLKKHKHFNELKEIGEFVDKIVLTEKYVEFVFDVKIDKVYKSQDSINISKKGLLKLSDGTKIKVDTDAFDRLETLERTSKEYQKLYNTIKTNLRREFKKLNLHRLASIEFTYKAVGKYYFACETCKAILKEFCNSNRVEITDTFTRKGIKNTAVSFQSFPQWSKEYEEELRSLLRHSDTGY